MTKTLLIGGSGRSGTTILCRAMGRHPDVTDVPEWRFTTDPDGIVDFYTQCVDGVQSPFHFDVRRKRLEALLASVADRGPVDAVAGSARVRRWATRYFRRNLSPRYARTDAAAYSPRFKEFSRELIDRLSTFEYPGYWVGMEFLERATMSFSEDPKDEIRAACREFLEAVAEDVCRSQGKLAHLEKNTWNTLCWDRTLEILPDAKLVHIVRDPRDVVSSYSVQPWAPDSVEQSARFLRVLMDTWSDVASRVPPQSYLEIRLEDLTRDPHTEYGRICEFWGLDWSDALLETKLSSSSFGRWKSELSASQVDAVTDLLGPVMARYGYA